MYIHFYIYLPISYLAKNVFNNKCTAKARRFISRYIVSIGICICIQYIYIQFTSIGSSLFLI